MVKTQERMRGKLKLTEDLPTVQGVWGLGGVYEMGAHVAVRPKGSYGEDFSSKHVCSINHFASILLQNS